RRHLIAGGEEPNGRHQRHGHENDADERPDDPCGPRRPPGPPQCTAPQTFGHTPRLPSRDHRDGHRSPRLPALPMPPFAPAPERRQAPRRPPTRGYLVFPKTAEGAPAVSTDPEPGGAPGSRHPHSKITQVP